MVNGPCCLSFNATSAKGIAYAMPEINVLKYNDFNYIWHAVISQMVVISTIWKAIYG